MLLAAWRRPGPLREDPRWGELEASIGRSAAGAIELSNGLLIATKPARMCRVAEAWIGWQYNHSPQEHRAGGPRIELTEAGLQLTAGPLPQYPLYYFRALDDSILVACSELAPLAELTGTEVDVQRLVSLISWRPCPDGAATAFVRCRRVLPCEHIAFDVDGFRSRFTTPRAEGQYATSRPEHLAAELRHHLDAAVERSIGDSAKVAVFTGGGLDSSGLLALAVARARGAKSRDLEIIAEVWTSPGDDQPHLRTLERDFGIAAVRLRPRQAGPWVLPSLCVDGQPQSFWTMPLELQLWQTAADRGASAILSGYAGDSVLGGAISFAPLALRGRLVRAVAKSVLLSTPRRLSVAGRLDHWLVRPLLRPRVPKAVVVAASRQRARRPWMTRRYVDQLTASMYAEPVDLPATPDEWLAYFCSTRFLPELAVLFGQLTSSTGALATDVYRDFEFVRFIARIDPMMLSFGGTFRGLFRLAMKGTLPESIRMRPDKAAAQPAAAEAIIGANAWEALADLASLGELARLDLVDPMPFQALFRAWAGGARRGERAEADPTDDLWAPVWGLLSAEAFLRQVGARGRRQDGQVLAGGAVVPACGSWYRSRNRHR